MGAPVQFRTSWYRLAPPWLRTGNAERYMYTMQLMSDFLVEKSVQAMTIRLPGGGDASQLPYLANDRALVQGPAEPNSSFVNRLKAAFPSWKIAGSALSVLLQLQAYITDLQPGVPASNPALSIVGGSWPNHATWWTAQVSGAAPVLRTVSPSNWNWDGRPDPWRAWLVVYLAQVSAGVSGSSASITSAGGGSLLGQNVAGVWVPGTSGSPVNAPFLSVSGLTGITPSAVGQWLTMSGSSHAGNNGTFPVTAVTAPGVVTIANPNGQVDAGPLTWSLGEYPWIGPGPVWGSPGFVLGQGQSAPPPVDTGSVVGGVWQPTVSGAAYGTTISWGLNVPPYAIQSIRQIVQRWKSAATYYPAFILAFDGGNGLAGGAYSPLSSPGSGNPSGQFVGRGVNVAGVWSPAGFVSSQFDCLCQGTGSYYNCSVENVT